MRKMNKTLLKCTFLVTEKVCISMSPEGVTWGSPDWLEGHGEWAWGAYEAHFMALSPRTLCVTCVSWGELSAGCPDRLHGSHSYTAAHQPSSQPQQTDWWCSGRRWQRLGARVVFSGMLLAKAQWFLLHIKVQSHLCSWSCGAGSDS